MNNNYVRMGVAIGYREQWLLFTYSPELLLFFFFSSSLLLLFFFFFFCLKISFSSSPFRERFVGSLSIPPLDTIRSREGEQ